MFYQVVYFFIASVLMTFAVAPFLIKFLKSWGIVRTASRNISDEAFEKNGTPIMGGLIFFLPILLLSIIVNFTIPHAGLIDDTPLGTIKILIAVFVISALLGGIDDVLNIFGKERSIRPLSRVMRLLRVHKSNIERLKLVLTLPWSIYKNFFFMLGSNPGKGVQAHEKILVQLVIGLIMSWWVFFKLGFDTIYLPFGISIYMGIFMIPFVILTLIFMANAVNITDGVDGLSSGLSIIAFAGFFITAYSSNHNLPIAILCIVVIGSLVGYLFFNLKPAKVQMGDIGSLSLGALLASVAFALNKPFLLVFFGGVFILELMTSLIQGIGRRILGRRIFKMAPLHHHFEMLGVREDNIVMYFWLAGFILFAVGLLFI
jgi:phospho-N-acetylmuramoyl-pentapeptide-transferase